MKFTNTEEDIMNEMQSLFSQVPMLIRVIRQSGFCKEYALLLKEVRDELVAAGFSTEEANSIASKIDAAKFGQK